MTVNESATASDGFGVAKSVAIEPNIIHGDHCLTPAAPTKRRRSGRVDFPGGVCVSGPHVPEQMRIYIDGLGWVTTGMAKAYAASLAGAVIEAERQAKQEAERRS
jgi:hypothetical protein